jgi:hypothetical protein
VFAAVALADDDFEVDLHLAADAGGDLAHGDGDGGVKLNDALGAVDADAGEELAELERGFGGGLASW